MRTLEADLGNCDVAAQVTRCGSGSGQFPLRHPNQEVHRSDPQGADSKPSDELCVQRKYIVRIHDRGRHKMRNVIHGRVHQHREQQTPRIWLVSFMNYDLGYVDLEERTLQPLDNPFGPKVLPM